MALGVLPQAVLALLESPLGQALYATATGTLAERFDTQNKSGAGWVRAKTGTLTGASALVGVVQTREGRVLSFALMSNGSSPDAARPALDAIAVALRECGCR